MLQLVSPPSSHIHQSKPTFLVSLDLSAAFDTIDHSILLNRLSTSFGIQGSALAWLTSLQTVFINEFFQMLGVSDEFLWAQHRSLWGHRSRLCEVEIVDLWPGRFAFGHIDMTQTIPGLCLQHKIDLAAPVTWSSGPQCRKRHWDLEAPVHLCFHCQSFVPNRCGQLKQLSLWNGTNDKQIGGEVIACAAQSARRIWSQLLFRLFLTKMSSSKLVEMSSYLPDPDSSSSILAGRLWISDCLERCLLPTTCCTSLQSSPPNPEAVAVSYIRTHWLTLKC